MKNADELKQIFREGWRNADVVAHRVERFIDGEFGFEPSRRAWLEALSQATHKCDIRRALDMGTGPGTIAQIWAELGYETTGVDFSSTMLSAAQQAATRRGLSIELIEADAEYPPFEPESFDLVSSRALLFTLPHPGYAIARWTKLLRPGGILVLIGENSPTDPERIKRGFRPAPNWTPDDEYRSALHQMPLREHTDSFVRVLMEAVGIEEIRNIPMQSVIAARVEHDALDPPYGVLQGTPYIVAGRRAED
ncbi:class I SAM-dependent methyltransferase [Blastopirellula marina]|uniref:Phosphatidylethanolamine N-methyltransferase n=1 Tax=Blastopirellula marina DSM 3645 TaxID=314230 RepID=A3ZPA7_9BACT|nr:class I SAM-dependent methyltransferase [Blastopirellula marina]EAQ81585.1 phosphatidylethanolamine N-methyltransferase [Blastopirellula marina DSM 3645]